MGAIAVAPESRSTLFAAGIVRSTTPPHATSVIYRSRDAGHTWQLIRTAVVQPVNSPLLAVASASTLYSAVFPCCLSKSTDGGETWIEIPPNAPPFYNALALDPRSASTLYVAIGGVGIFETTDGGISWDLITRDLGFSGQVISSVAIDPVSSNRVYATGAGNLYRTDDAGMTWQLLNRETSKMLWIAPETPSILFAQGIDRGLRRSSDAGSSWTPIRDGLPQIVLQGNSGEVLAVVTEPADPRVVYASTADAGVFRSTDGGSTFSALNADLLNLHVPSLAAPANRDPLLYAATQAGVFDLRERDDILTVLPAVASLHGVPPTFFHSDVWLFNGSARNEVTVTA
ncbi:MAG TPA: hypothetical protein VFW15_07165, partial [Thermoanaerobaculia bacterium]|nr:hypothetical protein [Thermoanaerobaculia bacterium]